MCRNIVQIKRALIHLKIMINKIRSITLDYFYLFILQHCSITYSVNAKNHG